MRGFFIISEGCMTRIFGKLVVFRTLVMYPALSAVNAGQRPEQHNLRDVCWIRNIISLGHEMLLCCSCNLLPPQIFSSDQAQSELRVK